MSDILVSSPGASYEEQQDGEDLQSPASMSKVSTSVEKFEYIEKFCVGPAISRPGPILLKVAATAVKLVIRSKLSTAIRSTENAKIST